MKIVSTIKNIFQPSPKATVAVRNLKTITFLDLLTIPNLHARGYSSFLIAPQYLQTDTLTLMWEFQQKFTRWKKGGINITFHISEYIDVYSLAAINKIYPVYLNKYAKIDMDDYQKASTVIRSDLRMMLNSDLQYNPIVTEKENDHSYITATSANTLHMISGISDTHFAEVIAASLLPQPLKVEEAHFKTFKGILGHDAD